MLFLQFLGNFLPGFCRKHCGQMCEVYLSRQAVLTENTNASLNAIVSDSTHHCQIYQSDYLSTWIEQF